MDIVEQTTREIHELHQFLQNWFNGAVPKTRENFARLADAWPKSFTLIFSDNEIYTAERLLEITFEQHGAFPRLSIRIDNLQITAFAMATAAVAIYEERHIDEHEIDVRLCSATLARRPEDPTVLQWVHVHESTIERNVDES